MNVRLLQILTNAATDEQQGDLADLGVVLYLQDALLGVEEVLLHLTHVEAGEVTQLVTFEGGLKVVLGNGEVLALQIEEVEVVAVGLPESSQAGAQVQFELLALQLAVLDGQLCIATLAAAVAVEEFDAYGKASTETQGAPLARGADIIVSVVVAVLGIEAQVGIVARENLLVVQLGQRTVLRGREERGVGRKRLRPQIIVLQVGAHGSQGCPCDPVCLCDSRNVT